MAIPLLLKLTVMLSVQLWTLQKLDHPWAVPSKATAAAFLLFDMSVLAFWRLMLATKISTVRGLPGPKSKSFLFGNISAYYDQARQVTRWILIYPNDGLLFFRGIFGSGNLFVTDVEGITDMMVHRPYDFEKPSRWIAFWKNFLGSGLFIMEGDLHKHHRKLVGPVFQQRRTDDLKPIMSSKAQTLVRRIKETKASEESKDNNTDHSISVDLCYWSSRFAIDIACILALGIDYDTLSNVQSPILAYHDDMLQYDDNKKSLFTYYMVVPKLLVRLLPDGFGRALSPVVQPVRRHLSQIAQERALQFAAGDQMGLDYLSCIVTSGEYNNEECADDVLGILVAGTGTTANVIAWIAVELAFSQEVQEALRQELQAVTVGKTFPVESIIDSLPLLHGVCHEGLRLHPPVPLTVRKSVRDTTIRDRAVPAGTYVVVAPAAMHQSPQIWGEDAAEFRPGRWIQYDEKDAKMARINNSGGASSQYCSTSFLYGPRGCIGRALAMAEVKRVVAALVLHFWIEAGRQDRPSSTGLFTSRPDPGFRVKLRPLGD
ncbi:hypothetical protein PG995_010889 [Apiospora arundinis]